MRLGSQIYQDAKANSFRYVHEPVKDVRSVISIASVMNNGSPNRRHDNECQHRRNKQIVVLLQLVQQGENALLAAHLIPVADQIGAHCLKCRNGRRACRFHTVDNGVGRGLIGIRDVFDDIGILAVFKAVDLKEEAKHCDDERCQEYKPWPPKAAINAPENAVMMIKAYR